MTNFEKKTTFLFKPVCTGSRKHFCHDGHREIIIVVIRNDRVLYGLYSVLFIDRINSKMHDKKDLPQNNGGLVLYSRDRRDVTALATRVNKCTAVM